ncbi:carbon starvation CstA family protein [Escherichia coli]
MVLFISSRRNGASLGEMIKEEMGPVPGTIALFGCFLIMIIILAVLALIVVKALARKSVGCLHRLLNRTDCAVYGYLHALYSSGACG